MAFDLPLTTPLPLLLGNENGVSAGGGGGGGGNSLFSLSASVGLTSADFDKGIARLQAAIEALNGNVSGMLSTLNTTVAGMSSNITNVGTDVDTASGKMSDGLGEIEKAADKASTSFDKIWTSAKNVLSVIGNVGKNLISFSLDIGGQLIEAGISYQQRERTYETAFKGVEKKAGEAMASLSETTGYYEGVLKGNFAKIQTQFRSAGVEQAEALELSKETMLLAADAAAHYGISMDDATYKVMSFIRGNQEAGESIGLFITQAKREEYAQEMYGKAWKALGEDERQKVLLEIAQSTYETGGQKGASARYSESFIVQMQNVNQIWADILGKLGTPILEALAPVVDEFSKVLSTPEMQEAIKLLAGAIGDFVGWLAEIATELLTWLSSEEGQAAFQKLMDMLEFALGWLGFIPRKDTPPLLEETTVESSYGNVPIGRESGVENPEEARLATKATTLVGEFAQLTHDGKYDDDEVLAVYEKIKEVSPALANFLIDNAENLKLMEMFMNFVNPMTDGFNPQHYFSQDMIETVRYATNKQFHPTTYEATLGKWKEYLKQDQDDNGIAGALRELPGTLAAVMAANMSGMSIQVDGVVLGHVVTPHVMANMARDVNFRRNTTT